MSVMSSPTAKPYLTCRAVLDFLGSYVDDGLTPEQRHEFDRHLAVCPSCVNYVNSYKSTILLGKSSMRLPGESASGDIPEGLINAIRQARARAR